MADKDLSVVDEKKQKALRILTTVYNLPSVPYVIMEVNKTIDNPNASATHLGQLVSKDQGLVTKILSVANSPLYGIPRRVSTVDFAIVILGFNHIKNIVIALSMMEAFKDIGNKNFNKKKYWQHSIMTATAAKRIADDLGYKLSGEVFTAGLLHDLGIPIINKYFSKQYENVIQAVKQYALSYLEAEEELLGINHAEIGKYLIDRWNLPTTLSEVVLHHHTPSNAENDRELVAIVHLADYMTNKLLIGDFEWDHNYDLDKNIIEILNLGDEEYLENFVQSYAEPFQTQLESINI